MRTFFLRCPDRKHFYTVAIFDSQKDLRAGVAKVRGKKCKSDKDIRALCLRYTAESQDANCIFQVTPELGCLFFVEKDMSSDVIVHELTHAAIGYANRTGLQPIRCNRNKRPTDEEKFAVCLQTLTEQFFTQCPSSS